MFNLFKSNKADVQKILDKLETIDKSRWLSISHTLNGWEFPLELYDVMPKWYLKNRSMERVCEIITPIRQRIDKEFGDKEFLRFHNVIKGNMSNLEFEYWYDNFSFSATRGREYNSNEFYNRKFAMENLKWWEDATWEKIKPLIKTEEDDKENSK